MKYYVIAGEASGDLHGSRLIKAIKALDATSDFRAWGGDLIQAEGALLVKHYRDLAFMGFKEVAANLPAIMRNFTNCKKDIESYSPDAIIFIDYPGFNMRMAKWARQKGFKTIYYISPQLWAWNASRAKKIKRDIDKMIVILPFEEEFYKKYSYPVDYVGHPLVEAIEEFELNKVEAKSDKKIITVLPGSRKQEISKMLPIMLKMVARFPAYEFKIAGAPGQNEAFYQPLLHGYNAELVFGRTYELLSKSFAAVVTSGTATLETALFEVPEVVCYKGSPMSYRIGKWLVRVPYISLVNLIMNRQVVPELIQDELTEDSLASELGKILVNESYRQEMMAGFRELKEKLGGTGASKRAAAIIHNFVSGA